MWSQGGGNHQRHIQCSTFHPPWLGCRS